ncbi:hypothetical protein [Streptococcus suis]|uniref:hypothetical protein n=1 Tax=Streptococcus suis TaxID=1307 RepID=UPI001ABECAA6|nr:hypothetical protein [Streptococcus suis]
MTWTVEKVGAVIESILNPGEELIYLYQSKTSQSIYSCVSCDHVYYKVFRISNHPSRSHYQQPTFHVDHGDFYMRGKIRSFLYQDHDWRRLKEGTFFLLRFMLKAERMGAKVYGQRRKGKLEVYLEEVEGEIRYLYRFQDNQVKLVKELLVTGLLISTSMGNSFSFRFYPTPFIVPYLERLKEVQAFNQKPAPQTLRWKVRKKLLTLVKEESLVTEDPLVKVDSLVEAPVTLGEKLGFFAWWRKITCFVQGIWRKYFVTKGASVKESDADCPQETSLEQVPQPVENQTSSCRKNAQPDPIKEAWKGHVKKRHRSKVNQVLPRNTLEQLEELKRNLPE